MSAKRHVMAIDVGTQSTRAFIFSDTGDIVASAQSVYNPAYTSPHPGWAEQDPEMYWYSVCLVCGQLWKKSPVKPGDVAAVALTSQRNTLINLDKDKKPLRPAIVWLDQRRASDLSAIPKWMRASFGLIGLGGTVDYLMAESEVNWLRQHEQHILDQTAHMMFLSGYINYKLSGQLADSVGSCVGYMPMDYKKFDWAGPLSWRWRALPIKKEWLFELVSPGSQLGEITPAAAEATGIPVGLPVIAGASDKACEVLGSGCLLPNQAGIGLGTTATINVNSAKYIEPIKLLPAYPSAKAGNYNLEVQIFRGFWMVTWFKEQFAQLEQERARQMGVAAEELLEELAMEVPPGSLGLVLQPYWSPGLRFPGPEARGAIIGFSGAHHKQHIYRAMLEGLAYALRDGRERIEKRTKRPITELYISGGGSRSDLAMQIAADVFKLPAARPHVYEASGLGAAILAAAGSGVHADTDQAVAAMTRKGRVFEPIAENTRIYDDIYGKVYRRMYGRLRKFYNQLMETTGFPTPPGQE